jgi:hypothetical protein
MAEKLYQVLERFHYIFTYPTFLFFRTWHVLFVKCYVSNSVVFYFDLSSTVPAPHVAHHYTHVHFQQSRVLLMLKVKRRPTRGTWKPFAFSLSFFIPSLICSLPFFPSCVERDEWWRQSNGGGLFYVQTYEPERHTVLAKNNSPITESVVCLGTAFLTFEISNVQLYPKTEWNCLLAQSLSVWLVINKRNLSECFMLLVIISQRV